MLTQVLRISSLLDELLHLLRNKQFPLASPLDPQMPTCTTIQRRRCDDRTQLHRTPIARFQPLARGQITQRRATARRGRGCKVSAG
jgi:hypothetical protein